MDIEFVDAYPFAEMGPKFRQLFQGARRVEGAVAFVTRFGADRWLELLNTREPPETMLVVSVRFPTDLAALCWLEPKMAGNLFIHTGYSEPLERNAERGQFHSKIVVIEYRNGEAAVVIGSHNWTENALCGINMEAGVIIRGPANDPVVAQARRHIAECALRSESFDPSRLRYYETIQSKLHTKPSSADSEEFEGFEAFDSLVIHAEDGTPAGAPGSLQLFMRVSGSVPTEFFRQDRPIQLFIYPKGSLFGGSTPTQPPVAYSGTITMQNTVADSPVEQRSVNCRIDNFDQPRLLLEAGGNIPAPTGERQQVVARLERMGVAELPIFHCAAQPPKMALDVETREIDRDHPLDRPAKLVAADDEPTNWERPATEYAYAAPTHLVVKCRVRLPEAWYDRRRVEAKLKGLLLASEFFRGDDVPEFIIDNPTKDNMFNQYVYQAYFRLTDESIARIRRQRPLIE